MKAYFISGLGADERAFQHIRLPSGYQPVYLHWFPPLPYERLADYAQRMAQEINTNEPFVLIGLSMGGMVASEIALHHPPRALILISSVPVSTQLPFYYHLGGRLSLHRLLPVRFLQHASWLKRFFTTESAADKELLRQMIRESDPKFIRWAVDAIVHWKNRDMPPALFQIHGTADLLLPRRYAKPDYLVRGAGHLMVLNRAGTINHFLEEILAPVANPARV